MKVYDNCNEAKYVLLDTFTGKLIGGNEDDYVFSLEDAKDYIYMLDDSPYSLVLIEITGRQYGLEPSLKELTKVEKES